MMEEHDKSHPREQDVFLDALEIGDLSARRAFLDESCGDDAHLRRRVEALLAAEQEADAPGLQAWGGDGEGIEKRSLKEAIIDGTSPTPDATISYFGDYQLIEHIASGAMGVVWRAAQVSLKRTVALKMIRGALLATDADAQRFRIEAESAASLDHPNIVPI